MAKIFWFQHDTGTLNDLRMQRVMRLHGGMMGIGMYWTLVELLHINGGKILFDEIPDLAYSMRVDEDQLMAIVQDDQVFESDEEGFWSNRVNAQLEKQQEASEKAKRSIEARWAAEKKKKKQARKPPADPDKTGTNEPPEQYDRNTTVVQSNNDRNTEEKRREEKIKEENISNEYITSSEPAQNAADSEPQELTIIELPCIGTPSSPEKVHKVTESDLALYEQIYPGINVRQELNKMLGWLDANPKRRKRNTKSFITTWLGRATDRVNYPTDNQRKGSNVANSVIRPAAAREPVADGQAGPTIRVSQL